MSEEQILKFIENWPMLEEVQRHMRDVLYSNRAERHWRGRDVASRMWIGLKVLQGKYRCNMARGNSAQYKCEGHQWP